MRLILGFFFILVLIPVSTHAKAKDEGTEKAQTTPQYETATFAGGCFWCMQPPFDKLEGVKETLVGYTGGKEKNPTYDDVAYGRTGHAEAVQIKFDPKVISYEKLLETFWHNINPTQVDGQFADKGKQYRTEIFFHSEVQKIAAKKSKHGIEKLFKDPIATKITKATQFYAAEGYHQKYYKKNPSNYNAYKVGSGRAAYIKHTWSKKKKSVSRR